MNDRLVRANRLEMQKLELQILNVIGLKGIYLRENKPRKVMLF